MGKKDEKRYNSANGEELKVGVRSFADLVRALLGVRPVEGRAKKRKSSENGDKAQE